METSFCEIIADLMDRAEGAGKAVDLSVKISTSRSGDQQLLRDFVTDTSFSSELRMRTRLGVESRDIGAVQVTDTALNFGRLGALKCISAVCALRGKGEKGGGVSCLNTVLRSPGH